MDRTTGGPLRGTDRGELRVCPGGFSGVGSEPPSTIFVRNRLYREPPVRGILEA